MGETTGISWTDHTFNTHWGCQTVSPACEACYAKAWSERVGHGKSLPVIWGGPSTERRFFGDKHWAEPLKWNHAAQLADDQLDYAPAIGTHQPARRRVFCSSMADVFEDRRDLDAVRERLRLLIAKTPALDWQLLTKRPHIAERLWAEASTTVWERGSSIVWEPGSGAAGWPSNVWLGATVEDRRWGVPRIAILRSVPAHVRFLSCEPLLEDLGDLDLTGIHQVIIGGESGGKPRPFDLAWARRLRDQCREQSVAFFCKQLGANPVGDWGVDPPTVSVTDLTRGGLTVREESRRKNGTWMLRDRKHGADMDEFPADLRVREYPEALA